MKIIPKILVASCVVASAVPVAVMAQQCQPTSQGLAFTGATAYDQGSTGSTQVICHYGSNVSISLPSLLPNSGTYVAGTGFISQTAASPSYWLTSSNSGSSDSTATCTSSSPSDCSFSVDRP